MKTIDQAIYAYGCLGGVPEFWFSFWGVKNGRFAMNLCTQTIICLVWLEYFSAQRITLDRCSTGLHTVHAPQMRKWQRFAHDQCGMHHMVLVPAKLIFETM